MKLTIISILVAGLLIGGAIVFSRGGGEDPSGNSSGTVSVVEGKQIIEVKAKGGYSPRLINAKANMLTTLTIKTQGTFDCSSALVIPALNYRKNLPSSGETNVEVPAQSAGSEIKGLCAMGMYSFTIRFN